MKFDMEFTTIIDGIEVEATNKNWPRPDDKCYDCHSDIPGHHTPNCEMVPDGAVKDLPQKTGTQYYDNPAI